MFVLVQQLSNRYASATDIGIGWRRFDHGLINHYIHSYSYVNVPPSYLYLGIAKRGGQEILELVLQGLNCL